jgi:hypothetical protein
MLAEVQIEKVAVQPVIKVAYLIHSLMNVKLTVNVMENLSSADPIACR